MTECQSDSGVSGIGDAARRIKKNADNALFAEFGQQFEAFKQQVKAKAGCGCK